MIDAIYPFTLELQKTLSQISIPVTLRDTKRVFLISLTNGGKPYKITDGCRAAFTGTKADGKILYNDCVIMDNTVIRYDFTDQTTSAPGRIDCQIKLYGEKGEILATPRFTMVVYKSAVDIDGEISEDEKTSIEGIIARETERIIAENDRKESFAEMMDSFGNLGGIEVSDTPPTNQRIAAWVDSDAEDEVVHLLTREDFDGVQVRTTVLSEITLLASAWVGKDNPYSQVVTIEDITEYTKVDLLPSVEQLAIFHDKDLAFVTENEDGVVTVYAIGEKPTNDYTMQVALTEVIV